MRAHFVDRGLNFGRHLGEGRHRAAVSGRQNDGRRSHSEGQVGECERVAHQESAGPGNPGVYGTEDRSYLIETFLSPLRRQPQKRPQHACKKRVGAFDSVSFEIKSAEAQRPNHHIPMRKQMVVGKDSRSESQRSIEQIPIIFRLQPLLLRLGP